MKDLKKLQICKRSVKGEVYSSTLIYLQNYVRVAEIVIEKAKRLVEMKKDVLFYLILSQD